VSRILLLIILATWLTAADRITRPELNFSAGLWMFFAGYVVLVLAVGVLAQYVSRHVLNTQVRQALWRFHWVSLAGRLAVPAWLAFGLLGPAAWGENVLAIFGSRYQFLPLIVGTAPALAAWAALWWAEYPAERALREQNLIQEAMDNLPIHAVPPPARQLRNNIRQQLLPIVVPVLVVVLLRDALVLAMGGRPQSQWGDLMMLPAVAVMYLVAPELFRWLFDTRPLPPGELRDRLDALCRRAGLRYRDILLWQTDHTVANAQVVGILPGLRYVMLSDRLLETMDDRQIEAVFAHEMGHIVHHHMTWFIIFFMVLLAAGFGPGLWLNDWLERRWPQLRADGINGHVLAYATITMGGTILMLGALSRRFERQADVYAARMMEVELAAPDSAGSPMGAPLAWAVGPSGAGVFQSALRRVAYVNNIPYRTWGLFHPSISKRLRYLRELSAHPGRTRQFDRFMRRLYAALLLALAICALIALAASSPGVIVFRG
jgi:STE24 endopeptidase